MNAFVSFAAGISAFCISGLLGLASLQAQEDNTTFKESKALELSQSVVGRKIGSYSFRDAQGKSVQLSDFLGKPLVLNFIYTACMQSCNVNTAWLVEVLDTAQDALGEDSFSAVTIGFDTAHDTPGRMRQFASQRGADKIPNWHFLSGKSQEIERLAEASGFTYFRSAKGFDHLDQVTLIDEQGIIRGQVYGEYFEKPTLIDPLKNMVFGTATPYRSLDDLIKKVKLFCTIYDPASERYEFNYSLFIQIGVGGLFIIGMLVFLIRDQIQQRRRRQNKNDNKLA